MSRLSNVYFIRNSDSDYEQLGKDALELLKKNSFRNWA